jgi:hypothetical protein
MKDSKAPVGPSLGFGPVISAIPFDDVDDLVMRGNATMFSPGGGWTRMSAWPIVLPRRSAPARFG